MCGLRPLLQQLCVSSIGCGCEYLEDLNLDVHQALIRDAETLKLPTWAFSPLIRKCGVPRARIVVLRIRSANKRQLQNPRNAQRRRPRATQRKAEERRQGRRERNPKKQKSGPRKDDSWHSQRLRPIDPSRHVPKRSTKPLHGHAVELLVEPHAETEEREHLGPRDFLVEEDVVAQANYKGPGVAAAEDPAAGREDAGHDEAQT